MGLCQPFQAESIGDRIWGSSRVGVGELAHLWGVQTTDSLEALGAEWPLHRGAKPQFEREREKMRYTEAASRHKRMVHVSLPFLVKLDALDICCLSLLNFVPFPTTNLAYELRASVEEAIGQPHGAPEILFCGLT